MFLYDNILYRKRNNTTMSSIDFVVLPKSYRTEIMTSMHDSKFQDILKCLN